MAKILVTGGAGYIGSHVLKKLGEAGNEIVVIDNLSTGRKESVLFGKLIEMDLGDTDKLDAIMKEEKFDSCFHFAGSIVVPESVDNPIKYYENNTVKTFNLLKLCIENKINKFIFSSTAAVYGEAEGGICTEETPIKPLNPYGKTKYMTEWMLEDFSAAYKDFEYVVFRYFNVAGANIDGKLGQCTPNATHLIKIASEVATGKRDKMSIFGDDYETPDGTCIRDYIHVDDLAQAHIDGLTYLNNGGQSQVMNCGYGKGYSVKEVLENMREVTQKEIPADIAPRRSGDAPMLISKAEKITKTIGWKPKHNDIKLICETANNWETTLKNQK